MNGNALGGAYFSHSANGGVASALRWFGGGAEDNGGAGVMLDNGARDLGVEGALFADNAGPGISALSGITAVSNSTFARQSRRRRRIPELRQLQRQRLLELGSRRPSASTAFSPGRRPLVGNSGSGSTTSGRPAGQRRAVPDGQHRRGRETGRSSVPNAMGGDMAQVTAGTDRRGAAHPCRHHRRHDGRQARAAPERAPWRARSGRDRGRLRGPSDGRHLHRRHADRHQRHQLDPGSGRHRSRRRQDHLADRRRLAGHRDHRRAGRGSGRAHAVQLHRSGATARRATASRSWPTAPIARVHDFTISNVNIEHVGGIGLDVLGNVSQGTVFNSWMHGDAAGRRPLRRQRRRRRGERARVDGRRRPQERRRRPDPRQRRARPQRDRRLLRRQ